MRIVAGISLNNLNPRVWCTKSPYYLAELDAVMVSYADLHRIQSRRKKAMDEGIHAALDIPTHIKVYLDNGAFYFLTHERTVSRCDYDDFVKHAKPDWFPIPDDYIPTPNMSAREQQNCYKKTMRVNAAYLEVPNVPVAHVSPYLKQYIRALQKHFSQSAKTCFALGGIVPNLLRSPKSVPHQEVIDSLRFARLKLEGKNIHVFGIGGTATVHFAALLGMDSVDSSGWRNRAARGIIQLPGSGDRSVADLGKWRGRKPDEKEWEKLKVCQCPACQLNGVDGLKGNGATGFANRATHNLWTLLQEARWIQDRLKAGTYNDEYAGHIYNSTYRPIIDSIVSARKKAEGAE